MVLWALGLTKYACFFRDRLIYNITIITSTIIAINSNIPAIAPPIAPPMEELDVDSLLSPK